LNENNLSQSNVSVAESYKPVLPQQSPTITINNKNIPHLQIPQNQSNQSDYTIKPLTPTNFNQKTSLN
jgi:Tfp pilus assembly protein PilX